MQIRLGCLLLIEASTVLSFPSTLQSTPRPSTNTNIMMYYYSYWYLPPLPEPPVFVTRSNRSVDHHYSDRRLRHYHYGPHRRPALNASSNNDSNNINNNNNNSSSDNTKQAEPPSPGVQILGRKQGVYKRPSGAIERGSGFFVPGLEGPKVRLAFGSFLLVLVFANHALSSPANGSDSTTANTTTMFLELLSAFYAALVLLQGLVQYRKETNQSPSTLDKLLVATEDRSFMTSPTSTTTSANNRYLSYQQLWSMPVDDPAWKERVEWAARTITALTPATHLYLVETNPSNEESSASVIFSYGRTELIGQLQIFANAASSTIAQSTSGRVALPSTHPVVQQLDPNFRKTVVLQRVNDTLCLVVASNQLLAAFPPTDLEWLGRIGRLLSIDHSKEGMPVL